jgi:D-alanyl-D-alanine carboxypeptidase/D-alanyl-D-alanine-endopeptidase (penicillin-binding protein 4)
MAASVQALPNMVWPKEGQKGALMAAAAPIPRLAWQAGKAMNPASVMKTVTTAVALQSLGADFQWQTTVWIDGALRDGTLYGNLIVQGGGDPYLPTAVLQELVDAIRSKGVQRIAGDFLVNQSLWHLPAFDPAAFDNKPERPYNASPQALMANMQALEVQLQVAGSEAAIKTEPPIVGIALPASVALSNSPCVQPEKILAPDFGVAGQISFKGSWPRSCGTRSVFYALPALQGDFAAQTLAGLWLASGGGLTGQARLEGRGHKGARRLLRFASRPLQEAATVTNTYSNNPMAKQIFLSLPVFGKLPRHLRRPTGSYSASQRWLADWWRLHLPQVAAPVLENGAGLSRRERISPGSLNALLAQTAASTVGAEFVQSLPLAGSQGTVARLAQRDPGNRAIGQARLKTGTLDDAKAIAGFVRGQSGQVYSVVAIINDGRAPAGQAAIDALLDWVAAESQ